MLQNIENFFTGLIEPILAIFDFLFGIIQDLLYVVGLLSKFLIALPGYLFWLPNEVVSVIIAIFGIVVIYKILGREG